MQHFVRTYQLLFAPRRSTSLAIIFSKSLVFFLQHRSLSSLAGPDGSNYGPVIIPHTLCCQLQCFNKNCYNLLRVFEMPPAIQRAPQMQLLLMATFCALKVRNSRLLDLTI